MKKKILSLLLILLILPCILAANLKIEKQSSNEVLIKGINQPAIFELNVTNLGEDDTFRFDSIPGYFIMESKEIKLEQNELKTIQLKVHAREDFEYPKFFYTLQYEIKGKDNIPQKEELTVKIIDLKNALKIEASEINPESDSITIYLKNKENFNFEKIKAKFSSPFFELEKEFSLKPYEKKEFTINLNKEDFKELTAGFYTLKAEIEAGRTNTTLEGTIKFAEKKLVVSEKKEYGFLITTKIISKKNEGNVEVNSDTAIKKNIVSRLFTTFEPEPDVIERHGMTVYYTWNRIVKPGETLNIIVKTNWLFPFLIIFFVIVIVIFAKKTSEEDLIVRKKVSFVKTKGGEFALKVSLIANAKKYVERINIIDKLPPLVKVYDKFGAEKPSRIDEKNKRIEWDIEKLEKGEIRIMSYIIYSKLGVLGKFALPAARIFYEVNGKIKETTSNRAFFVSEQHKGEIEEDY